MSIEIPNKLKCHYCEKIAEDYTCKKCNGCERCCECYCENCSGELTSLELAYNLANTIRECAKCAKLEK